MKFGSKDIPFVYKGDKLVYPNPIKDGLLLWYDFKGMRNTDAGKEVAKDLSGNGNDGTLTNFNFTEESGYKDNTLVFDGVDDKLTIPELELDETAMTVVHDGKLYAYEDDKVMTVGEDGEIIGSGKNVLLSPQENLTVGDYHFNNSKSFIVDDSRESGYRIKYSNYERTGVSSSLYLYSPDGDTFTKDITGETISFSFWMRGSTPFMFGSKMIGTEWTLWTWTGRKTTSNNHYYITRDETLNWFEISDVKVEIGDSVTSYSPSPFDYKSTTLSPTSLTDLQLYNKTLRKDELLHNAESKGLKKLKPGVVVQDGLVLHYDLSHESNTSEYKDKAFDYSGNGNHGVLNNFNFTEESGYVEDGLKFDGVDDFILSNSLDRDYIDPIKNFNFDFVLNQKDIASKGTIVLMPFTGQRLTVKNSEDAIAVGRYTSHWFGRKTPPLKRGINHFSINVILLGEGEYELNEPSFLIEMYVNGTLVEDVYASSSDYYSNVASVLTIGWQGTDVSQGENAYLNESLHSLKIYNRSLTPEEIAHNYAIEKEKFDIIEGEM